jgi:5-methylcytosine-specific restriction endonuclease McrBC GTP-binding regulatory subunit McrB
MPAQMGRFFMRGDGDNGGVYHPQAGRRFHSEKEMMAWASANGFEAVSPSSDAWKGMRDRNRNDAWKGMRDRNRNEADKDARRDGWRNAEERAATIRDKSKQRDLINANKQKQIDAYHDEHGSEGKRDVEQFDTRPEAG